MQIECIVTIVERGKGREVAQVLHDNGIAVQLLTHGHGTASSEIMDLLGLDEPEKDVVISMVAQCRRSGILKQLSSEMNLKKPGSGIAFAVLLTGINTATSRKIGLEKIDAYISKEMEGTSDMEHEHELVVAVVDAGNTDIVVDAAREAGVRGGTVMKAREVASGEAKKVFGIPIEAEKEIVLMLVPHAQKQDVLKTICNAVHKETGKTTVTFSMPVSQAVGLSG